MYHYSVRYAHLIHRPFLRKNGISLQNFGILEKCRFLPGGALENWREDQIPEAVDQYALHWAKREMVELSVLSSWKEMIKGQIEEREFPS